jgi:zinc protease
MKTPLISSQLGVESFALQNGSTLYFRHFEGAPRVAMGVYTHGGNRIEFKPGVADIIDDLLCEGTQKRTAEQIAVELDSFSLDLDTDTRRDFSLMNATFLEEDLEASVAFMADMLLDSTLAEFDKEKVRLQGELIMELDSPRNRSHDLLMTRLFQNSPYQASHSNILNTIPQLTSVSPLMEHYRAVYHPQNMIFIGVGDLEGHRLESLIEQYFPGPLDGKDWHAVNPPPPLHITEDQYITAAKDDSNQLHIFKGWFAPEATHPDYPAMVVLNTILGGAGLTSRLFLELRDKQGLAYVVRSQYESSKYTGIFSLYIGTEPNNRQKALKGFEVECQKLIDNPVGHQELEEAKENIMGRRVVFLETASQQCSYIGSHLSLGVSLASLDEIMDRVQAVTALQVQEVAQKYLTRPSIISAVGPAKFL